MAEWFSNLANQAMQYADGLADSIVAQADQAQSEIAAEQKKIKDEEEKRKKTMSTEILMPWETDDESQTILSTGLMEKIMALSLSEQNFKISPAGLHNLIFSLTDFVPVAMKLLSLDTNLARVHAKLIPIIGEELFWQNYHYRIMFLRSKVGLDPENQQQFDHLSEEDVIFQPVEEIHEAPVLRTDSEDFDTKLLQAAAPKTPKSPAVEVSSPKIATTATKNPEKRVLEVTSPIPKESTMSSPKEKSIPEPERKKTPEELKKEEEDLKAAMQAELENDIDLGDMDDLDLGDLEDELDGFDYLGDLDLDDDDELEAQIARELDKGK